MTAFFMGEGDYPATKNGDVFPYASIYAPRNYGIVTGRGVVALDVDGPEGREWLAAYEAEHGPLPMTPSQMTGRQGGGQQFLFSHPKDVTFYNSGSRIASGIDGRGEGGYVVAAPSIHPSGNFYAWVPGQAPLECPLAMIPEPLLEIMLRASKKTAVRSSGTGPVSRRYKAGITVKREKVKAPSDALPRGFEARVGVIGDGKGLFGFDAPIFGAACAWFNREGSDADPSELHAILRAAIMAAPKKADRDPDRYLRDGDAELHRQIERAQQWAETIENEPDTGHDED